MKIIARPHQVRQLSPLCSALRRKWENPGLPACFIIILFSARNNMTMRNLCLDDSDGWQTQRAQSDEEENPPATSSISWVEGDGGWWWWAPQWRNRRAQCDPLVGGLTPATPVSRCEYWYYQSKFDDLNLEIVNPCLTSKSIWALPSHYRQPWVRHLSKRNIEVAFPQQ